MKNFIERKIEELTLLSEADGKNVKIEHEGKILNFKVVPKEDAGKTLKFISNYPEPKILCYFFMNCGYINEHSICSMRFEKSRKEDIKSFLVELNSEYSIQDQKEFLIELKKNYENLLRNAKSIKYSEIKDIQIKKIEFNEEKEYDFLFRNFYNSCLYEFILEKSYNYNNAKQLITNSINDLPNIVNFV